MDLRVFFELRQNASRPNACLASQAQYTTEHPIRSNDVLRDKRRRQDRRLFTCHGTWCQRWSMQRFMQHWVQQSSRVWCHFIWRNLWMQAGLRESRRCYRCCGGCLHRLWMVCSEEEGGVQLSDASAHLFCNETLWLLLLILSRQKGFRVSHQNPWWTPSPK